MLAGGLRRLHGVPGRDRVALRVDRWLAEHGWVEEQEIEGIRWHLELDDTACRTAYLDGCHEAETSFYLQHLIRPGDRLWDIGACHGFVCLRMARLIGAASKVDAFEPVSLNRARLAVNFQLNPELAERIEVHPFALSKSAGTVTMQRTSARNPGASHIVTEKPAEDKGRVRAGEAGREVVEARRADEVWASMGSPAIAGVKIDVEGHELHVLAGMQAMVETTPPSWFLIEVRDSFLRAAGGSKEALFAWFAAHGYGAQRLVDGHKLVPDATPRNASAVLFRRKGAAG